jgi:hypothetical protein
MKPWTMSPSRNAPCRGEVACLLQWNRELCLPLGLHLAVVRWLACFNETVNYVCWSLYSGRSNQVETVGGDPWLTYCPFSFLTVLPSCASFLTIHTTIITGATESLTSSYHIQAEICTCTILDNDEYTYCVIICPFVRQDKCLQTRVLIIIYNNYSI